MNEKIEIKRNFFQKKNSDWGPAALALHTGSSARRGHVWTPPSSLPDPSKIPKSQSTPGQPTRKDPKNVRFSRRRLSPPELDRPPSPPAKKMHLWPSLRIRDSFKHGYLQKLELNLGHMKRAQRQRQGRQGDGQEDQDGEPGGSGKAPLLEDRSPSRSVLAGALELAWDAVLLLTCCCCCFCCGGMRLFLVYSMKTTLVYFVILLSRELAISPGIAKLYTLVDKTKAAERNIVD